MPVVHLAHEGLSVTICPIAGLAILPDSGIYGFWYAKVRGKDYYKSSQVLPGLPWERCVKVEISPLTDIRIILKDAQNMPILIHLYGLPDRCLHRLAQVTRLQAWWRGVFYLGRTKGHMYQNTHMIFAGLLQSPWFLQDLFFRFFMLSHTGVSMLITADVFMDWGLFR